MRGPETATNPILESDIVLNICGDIVLGNSNSVGLEALTATMVLSDSVNALHDSSEGPMRLILFTKHFTKLFYHL